MNRIKILYLIDKLVPAGTQTNLLELVKRIDRSKFEPHLVTIVEGGELEEDFEAAGVEPIVLDVRRVYGPSGFRALSFLTSWMQEERFDIVQTHFLHADILGTLAAKWTRVPRIVTARRDEGFWRSKRQLLVNRYFNRFVDRVLCNSKAVREAVRRNEEVSSRKLHVIYNGVDLRKFYPSEDLRHEMRTGLGLKDEEIVLGMVANMRHAVKGHRFLIKALSLLCKEMDHVRLILVGDGPLETQFERYAAHRNVLDQILFLGARRDITEIVNAIDIVCAPSLSEGFSNSILEAMAIGKPVVATNVGGNPELVVHGETGYLVRPRDGNAMAEKVSELIRDSKLRVRMGDAARLRIQNHFTVEKMVKEYEAFYQELVGRGAGDKEHASKVKRIKRVKREYDKQEFPVLQTEASNASLEPRSMSPVSLRRSRRIRVLLVIWSLDLGGAEQVVVDLARKLNRQTFKPLVCCLNEKGRFAPILEKEGIRVIALHKRPKFDPFLISKLNRLIKMEKIDLIHTHMFTANLWGRISGKLTGIPVISSEHGMDHWRRGIRLALDRMLTPVSKRIVFVSEAVKRFYEERNQSLNGKCRVIHNGINLGAFEIESRAPDVRAELGLSGSEIVIGTVGRLVPEKAHTDFIEAIRLLNQKRSDILGLIIGEGELFRPLQQQVQDHKLERQILFAGFRSNLPKFYQAMNVFVLCSLREGFPLVILEAMASGVPVVATEVGGIKELVKHEEDGLLVPAQNPKALAEAIGRILEDGELRERLVTNARQKVRMEFSVEQMVKRYEALYAEVLGS